MTKTNNSDQGVKPMMNRKELLERIDTLEKANEALKYLIIMQDDGYPISSVSMKIIRGGDENDD